MSREEMIQLLIFDVLEHAAEMEHYCWLQQILETGFLGFASMTDKELVARIEAKRLGVDERTTGDEDDDFDRDDLVIVEHLLHDVAGYREIEAG